MFQTIGNLVKEVRIKSGTTLRTFCLGRELDPVRFSLIERDELRPNDSEVDEYLNLVAELGKLEETTEEVRTVALVLKIFSPDVPRYCMSCGSVWKEKIFGLFEKKTGALVNIVAGEEKPFVCKPCQKRIDMVGKKEKHAIITKDVKGFEIRQFVREMIFPEITEAVKDHSFGDGLAKALGLK